MIEIAARNRDNEYRYIQIHRLESAPMSAKINIESNIIIPEYIHE